MSANRITCFENGKWRQNCYLISNVHRELLIIDPGSGTEEIIRLISELRSTPLAVLTTHAHYDHIGSISELVKHYQIPFYMHGTDKQLLQQANTYKFLFDSKSSVPVPVFDRDLCHHKEGLTLGEFIINVIHTPGHTPGSVCFVLGQDIFTGDTLLSKGLGRADLPGGDKSRLIESVSRLRQLGGGMRAYPGHGGSFLLSDLWSKLDG